MRYMGGKVSAAPGHRRRAEAVHRRGHDLCGAVPRGGWSFAHVIETCRPGHAIGADVNGSLIELWRKVVAEGVDWLPTSLEEVEANYAAMRERDRNGDIDPLLAWYGAACSFGGRWFEGVARSSHNGEFDGEGLFGPQARSTEKKAASMRTCPDLTLLCCSYEDLGIPDGAVVYCDPPYNGRYGKLGREFRRGIEFDPEDYYNWVRELAQRCVVVCSTFDAPEDFVTVHDWGDTRITHLNGRDRAERPTTERLIRYDGGLW